MRETTLVFPCFLAVAVSFAVGACGSSSAAGGEAQPDASSSVVSDASSSDAGDERGACDGGAAGCGVDAAMDGTTSCTGMSGTFHNQSIMVGGEARYYLLHVPPSYTCKKPWPMMVDFHGTAFTAPVPPEELWNLDDAIKVADAEGYILVRPRSRSKPYDGLTYYQWDINPGDVALNIDFTSALVRTVGQAYSLDPARQYAMGFSNGTNMAAQFLGTGSPQLFSGIGIVMGGLWTDPGLPSYGTATAPRIYVVDGYRDYLYESFIYLQSTLAQHSYPPDHLFYRETNAGHEQYGWHFKEMFEWLDLGKRPAAGTLASPWSQDTTFPSTESLVAETIDGSGNLILTGGDGSFFRRAATTSAWSTTGHLKPTSSTEFSGACVLPSGNGLAVSGDQSVAQTSDGGKTWALGPPVPSVNGGSAALFAIACTGASTFLAVGYFDTVLSTDGGATWSSVAGMFGDGIAVGFGQSGTAVAGGGSAAGRRTTGDFQLLSVGLSPPFWNGVAAAPGGNFWLVGTAGAIAHSGDDGATWSDQSVAGGDDLYAVAFADANVGVAVGVHGYAVKTSDGGTHWTAVPTGLDAYLGSVAFATAQQAVVVGEKGLVLTIDP